MEETKSLSALNCIRNNRKTSREEIHELYGAEGVFVYDLFLARYSDAVSRRTIVQLKKDERKFWIIWKMSYEMAKLRIL